MPGQACPEQLRTTSQRESPHWEDHERQGPMNIPSDLDELTALLEKFGAREPASWAKIRKLMKGFPSFRGSCSSDKRGAKLLARGTRIGCEAKFKGPSKTLADPMLVWVTRCEDALKRAYELRTSTTLCVECRQNSFSFSATYWMTLCSLRRSSLVSDGDCFRSIAMAIQLHHALAPSTSRCSRPIRRVARCGRGKRRSHSEGPTNGCGATTRAHPGVRWAKVALSSGASPRSSQEGCIWR